MSQGSSRARIAGFGAVLDRVTLHQLFGDDDALHLIGALADHTVGGRLGNSVPR